MLNAEKIGTQTSSFRFVVAHYPKLSGRAAQHEGATTRYVRSGVVKCREGLMRDNPRYVDTESWTAA